jgi:hypothetical protein
MIASTSAAWKQQPPRFVLEKNVRSALSGVEPPWESKRARGETTWKNPVGRT